MIRGDGQRASVAEMVGRRKKLSIESDACSISAELPSGSPVMPGTLAWSGAKELCHQQCRANLVLPDSRTSFHLQRESGPTQLTNANSLEGGYLLKFKTIGSAQCHTGSAITNR